MCYCIWLLSRHMSVTFILCLTLNPAVGGGMGCIRGAPLWVSNSGSQRSLSEHPVPLCWCSRPLGSKQEEHPGRPCPLRAPIQAGIWEPRVPDHTPPKGLQRKSPAGRGKLDGALRSQDERTAQGHCPWPPVQRGGGGEGVPCPLRLQGWASASWDWHCQALQGFCSEKLLSKEAGSPGLRYWGVGDPGPRPQGLPPTSRAAPRQPGSGAVCGFRISCRCHPERPADRQGSHPLSKTPFHLPGLITPAERRRGHWSQPPPSSPVPAPKPPASGTHLLPPFCQF